MTTPLTLPAQLNAIRILTEMAHADALAGNNRAAIQRLNQADALIHEVVGYRGVDTGNRVDLVSERLTDVATAVSHTANTKLLDEIAVGQLGRKYNRATQAQQKVIRELAGKVVGERINEDDISRMASTERDREDTNRGGRKGVQKDVPVRDGRIQVPRVAGGEEETTVEPVRRQVSWHQWLKEFDARGGVAKGEGESGGESFMEMERRRVTR